MTKLFFGCMSLCLLGLGLTGCMKMPKFNAEGRTTMTYHFEGGEDITSLFSLNITYVQGDGKTVTEDVPSLPWSKTVVMRLPFQASLKAKFAARTSIPVKSLYDVGFDGYLTYNMGGGSESAPIRSATRAVTQNSADPNVLHLRVRNLNVPPQDVSLEVAPLKFDKHFAFTFTADDSYTSAYSRIWSLIHAKWIDNKEFCHLNRPRSTGYTPEYPLVTTDGCGNDRRFGFSCAIWPTFGDANNEIRIKDASRTADNSVYISWEELTLMTDFGVSLLYHNVDEEIWDKTNPQQIMQGLVVDHQKTFNKTGVRMKILGVPDGNAAYAEAAQLSDKVVFTRNAQTSSNRINLQSSGNLYKKETYGGINSSDTSVKLDELAAQSAAQNPYWVGLTYHRPDSACLKMFQRVYELYGKPGKDNLWVASWDEVYEYVTLREGAQITSTVNGEDVDFFITLPDRSDFQFEELSLLLDGAPGAVVEVVSDNIVGMTHAPRGNAELINVRFGTRWTQLAEKYVAEYEAAASQEALSDARYFVGQLRPELAEPFERRISTIVPPAKDQVTYEGVKRYQKQYGGYLFELSRKLSPKK